MFTKRQQWYSVVQASVLLALFTLASPVHASWVNVFGLGRVSAEVWCAPAAPPGAPTASAGAIGASPLGVAIPGTLPLPAACTPGTAASASTVGWFGGTFAVAAAGGDWAAAGADELVGQVTPVNPFASASMTLTYEVIDTDSVGISYTWSGSDAGTAGLLRILDQATGSTIFESIKVGAWSETVSMIIDLSVSYEYLSIESAGIASSISAPPSLFLAACGLLLLAYIKRRAPWV